MIAKAKSISHGINDISYITGESRNKKHPERIFHVKDNLLPPGLDATGIWDSMRLTLDKFKKVKNSVIRIEVSPAPEHTKDFTIADWEKLWDDFIREFDNIELYDKNGRTYSPKTNLTGSKGTVRLHLESKSGIPHLHGAFCRIDEQGRINNDHDIHLRAQRAAERVALKRGWTTAAEVRDTNIGQVNRDCMEILQSMESWSWLEYAARLRDKGYELWELQDGKNLLRGYVLKKGNARYIQGFRTRQGAQPHGEQARKHVEEAARGSQGKGRFDETRRRHTGTDHRPPCTGQGARNGTASAIYRLPPRHCPVPYRRRQGKPRLLHTRRGPESVRRGVRLPRDGQQPRAHRQGGGPLRGHDVGAGRTLRRRWRRFQRPALGKTRGRG